MRFRHIVQSIDYHEINSEKLIFIHLLVCHYYIHTAPAHSRCPSSAHRWLVVRGSEPRNSALEAMCHAKCETGFNCAQ